MVFQLLPIIVGAVAAYGIGKGIDSVAEGAGDTKKELRIGGEYHAPQEVYSPTITDARVIQYPDYNIAVDSPLAQVGSKKEATASPDVAAGVAQAEGTNMTHIALIGAVGIVLYGLVKK